MIVVLGAGVIGVTTAYYLAKRGHRVVVVERRSGVALETSFANAGEISPGYASPWAGPGAPLKAVKWLAMKHGPLRIAPRFDPQMWLWLVRALSNCTESRYSSNKARMVALAEFSRDRLRSLRDKTGIEYESGTGGTLQLFRSTKQFASANDDMTVLRKLGVRFELLEPSGCVAAEPGLANASAPFVGGLRLPDDETGDCHIFTRKLSRLAMGAGVEFRFNAKIEEILVGGGRVTGVKTSDGVVTGDRYVVALGTHTPAMVRKIGVRLPIYPVKGYSLTTPVIAADRAPRSTVMDETYKVATTRLGQTIRVGGIAELSGFSTDLPLARRETLLKSLGELFPGSYDADQVEYWSGLRPMTPDGPPIIGLSCIENLYINAGHGTLGWTMACGGASLLADEMSGIEPPAGLRPLLGLHLR